MARIRRYTRDAYLRGGALKGTNSAIRLIRRMVNSGQLRGTIYVLKEDERLDHIAARKLGSAKLWWGSCSYIWYRVGIAGSGWD